jgi:hypothetical protein
VDSDCNILGLDSDGQILGLTDQVHCILQPYVTTLYYNLMVYYHLNPQTWYITNLIYRPNTLQSESTDLVYYKIEAS